MHAAPLAEEVVACARSWLGTRFHHQGRVKKTPGHRGGCDCLGLLIGVAQELQLLGRDQRKLAAHDALHYGRFPDGSALLAGLRGALRETDSESMQPGDVLLMRVENAPRHLAIVSDYPDGLGMIHAYAPLGSVVEHRLDARWLRRIHTVFRIG